MDMKRLNEEIGKLDRLSDHVSAFQKRIQAVKKSLKNNIKVKERTIKKLYEWRPIQETEAKETIESNEVLLKETLNENDSVKDNENSSKNKEKIDVSIKNNAMDLNPLDNDEESENEKEIDTDSLETFSLEEIEEKTPIKPSVVSCTMWEKKNCASIERNYVHHRSSFQRDQRNDHQRTYYNRNFRFLDRRITRKMEWDSIVNNCYV
jgi:hypothetical protein